MRGMPARALLSVCVLFGAFALADETTPALLGLRHDRTDTSTRVVLESSGPLVYTYYSPDPLTLVVDLPDVDAAKLEQSWAQAPQACQVELRVAM